MDLRARGPFSVDVKPQADAVDVPGSVIGRMSIDKKFHGDLDAKSIGQMMTAMTDVDGSAGYVAIEWVTGKLGGRSGSFALQHSGTMARGAQKLDIVVVPDSGSGELTGITGSMKIIIEDGDHSYDFEYALPEKA
jgi:hypothetical protein